MNQYLAESILYLIQDRNKPDMKWFDLKRKLSEQEQWDFMLVLDAYSTIGARATYLQNHLYTSAIIADLFETIR